MYAFLNMKDTSHRKNFMCICATNFKWLFYS